MNADAENKKAKLIKKLQEMGYETDPRGNFICTATQRLANGNYVRRRYRIKLQDISVRFEVQGLERHPKYNTLPWLRVTSSYYSNIVECDDGRLRLGSMFIGTRKSLQPA